VGNDDNGQMSAWYVMASSGIHPVCQGDNRMEITSPIFSKITFTLDAKYATGKQFTIIAKNNAPANSYISSATLNGKPYNKSYLDYKDITAGSTLVLTMTDKPNEKWGIDK
jgi:putative alpha-1,2-mannosidase